MEHTVHKWSDQKFTNGAYLRIAFNTSIILENLCA